MEQNAHTPVPVQDHFRHLLAEFGETLFKDIHDLRRNPVALYLSGQTIYGRRMVVKRLITIIKILTGGEDNPATFRWWTLQFGDMLAIRTALSERLAFSTVNSHLSMMRVILKHCWRLHFMDGDPYYRAISIENIPGKSMRRGRYVAPEELEPIFKVCAADPTPRGARDAAMLALLYGTGLRLSELVGMDFDDYKPEDEQIQIRDGKFKRARVLYVVNEVREAMDNWLIVRGREPGPLFCATLKYGYIRNATLHRGSIRHMIRRRIREAGGRDFTPQDMRRSFISNLLDLRVDLFTAQNLAGHAWPQTTALYDRRPERKNKAAMGLVHFPYQGRARPLAVSENMDLEAYEALDRYSERHGIKTRREAAKRLNISHSNLYRFLRGDVAGNARRKIMGALLK